MVAVKYTLDDFVQEMEELLATQPNNERIFDRGSDYLARLIANPEAIPERFPATRGSREPGQPRLVAAPPQPRTVACWLPPWFGDPATTPPLTTIAPGA